MPEARAVSGATAQTQFLAGGAGGGAAADTRQPEGDAARASSCPASPLGADTIQRQTAAGAGQRGAAQQGGERGAAGPELIYRPVLSEHASEQVCWMLLPAMWH